MLRKLEKQKQNHPKISRKKGISKIRKEINQRDHKSVHKINESEMAH